MFTLIVRSGCHLCEQAEASLRELEVENGIVWEARGIDEDPAYARFTDDLPVLLKDGQVLTRLTSSKAALGKATKPGLWSRIRNSLHIN